MTKLIAKHTVKSGNKYYAPGENFDVSDPDTVTALVDGGAAERRTRAVADDEAPATGPAAVNASASGQTSAPDPNAVAAASKSSKR